MSYSPLAIKRMRVLGDIYNQCDSIESIPVYLETKSEEPVGFVDEGLGKFADAFLFHLPEDICKKLSTSHYNYSFDFDYSEIKIANKKRIKLNFIIITAKKKISVVK
jgi:hypothetical protein